MKIHKNYYYYIYIKATNKYTNTLIIENNSTVAIKKENLSLIVYQDKGLLDITTVRILNGDRYLVSLLPNFTIKDINHVIQLEIWMRQFLSDLTCLSDTGYVNDNIVNIPVVFRLLNHLGLDNNSYKKQYLSRSDKEKGFSLLVNVLYYNLLQLIMLFIVVKIESWLKEEFIKNPNARYLDVEADIKTLRLMITRMLNPVIKDKLSNRGLSIALNTYAGYDSEYELSSSLDKTNELLSVQLAVNTGLYVKVPIVDVEPIKISDYNERFSTHWGEKILVSNCLVSTDKLIQDIRALQFKEHDKLLDILINHLDREVGIGIISNKYKLYSFKKTDVETFIKYTNVYTSSELFKDADDLKNDEHERALLKFLEILDYLIDNPVGKDKEEGLTLKLRKSIHSSVNKSKSRISYGFYSTKLNISINRTLYICMHESSADLSMLKDFDDFKESLNIVSRYFVTLGKPLVIEGCKSKVHIRDTALLAPVGFGGLDKLGSIYGPEYRKVDIGDYRQGRMKDLLKDDKSLFESYAIKDSIITLKHINSMEEFYVSLGKTGVPLTLSGIGKSYVLQEWSLLKYRGYQPRKDLLLGNISNLITPKNARSLELIRYIVPYITSYRGGRNESFMYGLDIIEGNSYKWIDYDLTSAYTTIMSILGDPDYSKARRIFNKTVESMDANDLLLNYLVIEVDFVFPLSVKYPSIPTRVDDDMDIYPLKGTSIITGSEYLVAKSMGCRLYVKEGVIIPFKNRTTKDEKTKTTESEDSKETETDGSLPSEPFTYDLDYKSPYRDIIKGLQSKRREHPAKTFYNLLYKTIGNSIYGQVAMGFSGKTGFDIKTHSYIKISGGDLSNPILAGYITGFARSLIGECLNNISLLKGRVVSVTTDGFITDVEDLENKLLQLPNIHCLLIYRDVRRLLTTFDDMNKYDPRALEIKTEELKGLLSWKTRGQLGLSEGGLSAASGFQAKYLDKPFMITEFLRIMNHPKGNKDLEFIQTGLRSATDIYKEGGHVVQKYKDHKFSLNYDNKRRLVDYKLEQDKKVKQQLERLHISNTDLSKTDQAYSYFLDSVPWSSIDQYAKIRILNETISAPKFVKGIPPLPQGKGYKTYIETAVRAFIKACLSPVIYDRYGIPTGFFNDYQSIIDFVYLHEPAREVKLSLSSVSKLKNRSTIGRAVPRLKETECFVNYIKTVFKDFDDDRFFKELSPEAIKKRKREKEF